MNVLATLLSEIVGLVLDYLIRAAVLAALDVGLWLRNHHVLPDLWFRRRATYVVLWLTDRVARAASRMRPPVGKPGEVS